MRPSKILVLAETFPNAIQPWLLNWLLESKARGIAIDIIANRPLDERVPAGVLNSGLDRNTLHLPFDSLREKSQTLSKSLLSLLGSPAAVFKGALELTFRMHPGRYTPKEKLKALCRIAAVSRGRYDLIHSHTLPMSNEFLFVADLMGIPMITTFHGLPPIGVPLPSSRALTRVFQRGNLFLVNTEFAKTQLVSLGCDASKIRLLPQGTRLEDYPFLPAPYSLSAPLSLLTVGRLHPDKGHQFAIRAVRQLVDRGLNVHYTIVGSGPCHNELQELILELKLSDRVRLLGGVSETEVRAQYCRAHILILPSLRSQDGWHEETQGVVLQEAQASGVLVIATLCGGIPECVVHGDNALLVPDRNPEALAAAVLTFANNPSQWNEWRLRAREHVERHFSSSVLTERLLELYSETVEMYHQS